MPPPPRRPRRHRGTPWGRALPRGHPPSEDGSSQVRCQPNSGQTPPFLQPGCVITLPPGARVTPHDGMGFVHVRRGTTYDWPHVSLADGGELDLSIVPPHHSPSEMLYVTDLGAGWYEISNPEKDFRVRISWDLELLPYLWLWGEYGSAVNYPFWGRYYTLGLEPMSSLPNLGLAEAASQGTALRFGPYESKRLHWSVEPTSMRGSTQAPTRPGHAPGG